MIEMFDEFENRYPKNQTKFLEWMQKTGNSSTWKVFVFDWWWASHQSSAHKSLSIFKFCIMSGMHEDPT